MHTREQLSEFQEAVAEALAISNRRGSPRIAQECHAEMSPWEGDRAGTAFGVVVENISTTGVGIRHTNRLKEGARYLLEIPRPGTTALAAMLKVTRCQETAGGWFEVEMTPQDVLEVAAELAHRASPRPSQMRRMRRKAVAPVATAAAAVSALLF